MASSSVSQDDHDDHFVIKSLSRTKVRSARAIRTANTLSCRGLGEEVGDCNEGETQGHIGYIPKYDQTSVVLVESNDASPKPVIRGINKDKRTVPRGAHAGKSNKGMRDRRKLREKRRSTAIGVLHVPSTESTGGSTGEDENEENSIPPVTTGVSKPIQLSSEIEDRVKDSQKGKSESDLDADDEAAQDSSEVNKQGRGDSMRLKLENQRLIEIVAAKDRRIAILELQVTQLTKQVEEIKEQFRKIGKLAS